MPSAPMEPWQWLYLALLVFAALRLLSTVFVFIELRAKRPSKWLAIPAALGFVLMYPYALLAVFVLHVVLIGVAPLGANIIAGVATFGSILVFMKSFAPRSPIMLS